MRGAFFEKTREEARAALGITDDRPLLLSYWGSLGAEVMNGHMTDFLRREAAAGAPFRHIHGAGRNYEAMCQSLADVALPDGVELREYIYDMPTVMRAADLVLCRAGASTLSEVSALALPAVIVPSPNVTNHHQERNAAVLGDKGAAVVLPEPTCSGAVLYRTARDLLADPARRRAMSQEMALLGIPDAAEHIYATLIGLIRP